MFTINSEQLLEVFRRRVSTRAYDPNKKISPQDFETILECARLSPSSVASEPWHFVIIQSQDLRDKLKPIAWGMTNGLEAASHIVAILAKKNVRYDSDFMRQGMVRRGIAENEFQAALQKYQKFQEIDIDVLQNERTLWDWSSKQTYIALANMMTGAAMLGIDSCPVEGFNYAAVNQLFADEGIMNADEWAVSVMLTFGYRANEIKPKARKALNEITTWIE